MRNEQDLNSSIDIFLIMRLCISILYCIIIDLNLYYIYYILYYRTITKS